MKINKYTIKGEELVTIELSSLEATVLEGALSVYGDRDYHTMEYYSITEEMEKGLRNVLSK
jgi:hypothetical protein